jgi:hypothetical protein
MKVQAAPGAKCPKEGRPREYITDNTPVEVPDSAYYLRLVADGSLVAVATTAENADRKGGKK